MNNVKSFDVDHSRLKEGFYISTSNRDIVTYDIRMARPNTPPYLENAAIHSFEHLLAAYVRSSEYGSNIVYVGPMGCRTGFYLITREIAHADVLVLVKRAMSYIAEFAGDMPGVSEKECGNYREHDLQTAKKYAQFMENILKNWNEHMMKYAFNGKQGRI